MTGPIRIGARSSPLARVQAGQVAALLAARGHSSTFVGVTTVGDVDRRALTEIGGAGVFAGAVREALLADRIDVAVHSLKDLPTAPAAALELAAVPRREDTRDVLVGLRLADLADGHRIGTGAPRRAVQLLDHAERAGIALRVVPVRGNVGTRLDLVRGGRVDAVLLAAAGLIRLGLLPGSPEQPEDTVVTNLQSELLPTEVMLPAPGQGALALETLRAASGPAFEAVRGLDDPASRAECAAERAFLATLEAGCTAPVGARAVVKSVRGTTADLTLDAVIGRTLLSNLSEPAKSRGAVYRTSWQGSHVDPAQFGADAAREVLATLQDTDTHNRTPRRET